MNIPYDAKRIQYEGVATFVWFDGEFNASDGEFVACAKTMLMACDVLNMVRECVHAQRRFIVAVPSIN